MVFSFLLFKERQEEIEKAEVAAAAEAAAASENPVLVYRH
jgi:hypothetical protein